MSLAVPILYISSRANTGAGGERYLYNVMRHVDRVRFEPHVLLPGEGSFRPLLEELGIVVHIVESKYGWLVKDPNWYNFMHSLPERVARTEEIIRKNNIKIVHTNSNIRFEGLIAANLVGAHHLYAARVDFQPELDLFKRLGFNECTFARFMGDLSTKVLSVSQSVADRLSPPIDTDKIRVIHNGINLEDLQATTANSESDIRTELGLSNDDILVTAAGRVSADKGFDTYLLAAADIVHKHSKAHFLIAGKIEDPSYQNRLQAIAREKGIESNVHFLGFRDDIHPILTQSDIFVLSSRREGQSNALLEALACKCAVVATRCSGVEEIIQPGVTGFIVEIEDHRKMAEDILLLVEDTKMRRSLSSAGFDLISNSFQLRKKVEELMDLYDEILSLPPPKPGSPIVHILLQHMKETGLLGRRVEELDERLKQTEQFVRQLNNNILARMVRKLKRK